MSSRLQFLTATLALICALVLPMPTAASDLVITGVVDGSLPGGLPKAVEVYATSDIADLSSYSLGSANNGGGSDGEEFSFPADAVAAGTFLYVASESTGFGDFFGFAPDYTSSMANINGDDAIELFQNGAVVDIFGDIDVDGTGQPWDHIDGWAYRNDDSGPDGNSFVLVNWFFSGPDALDGETTNDTAGTPFPLGSFVTTVTDSAPFVAATVPDNDAVGVAVDANVDISFSEDVTTSGVWYSIECTVSGDHIAVVGGGPQSFTLDPDIDFESNETCTVTVFADQISDVDADDPPDSMAADVAFGFEIAGPSSGWVINEIHADPASGPDGDANGDGEQQFSDDEFVEIVNASGADVDITGWTLSDGFGVRHVFGPGAFVPDGCGIVVFGGGSPTGDFGAMPVQTASNSALGLNNGGDTVTLNDGVGNVATASYGSEGGDNQSLTRDPDVTGALPLIRHSLAAGSGGALYSPGTRVDGASFEGCSFEVQVREIFEIQGDGLFSPFTGQDVITEGNVVTALATDGFFIQTPAARSDGDLATSDGIFVFTGAAPTVAVGDRVDVAGEVQEFFDFTEISGSPAVTVVGSGEPLPAAVPLDSGVPSPNPATPSCGAFEYECYEGMRVTVATGTVTGPNQRFGTDPIAEVHFVAGSERAFREPGIAFPGLAGLPVWDGNPEVFELDPDKLGLPNRIIPAGSTFSAAGVIGFEFGDYELWPSELTVNETPLPEAVRPRDGEFTVGSLNLFRLFDDVDDPADIRSDGASRNDTVVSTEEYARRLDKFTAYILEVLDAPDILAVQEAEKLGVLEDLAQAIADVDPAVVYSAHLVEGNDIGTIDVGFLTREHIQVDAITQFGKDEILAFDNSLLNDRPPLLLEGSAGLEYGSFAISVMVLHNRSLGGIEDPGSGPRVRQKRYEQAQSVAARVQAMQAGDAGVRLVVIGDFNAFEFTDGFVDVTGLIAGEFDPADNLVCDDNDCADLVEPTLSNQVPGLDPEERYSFIFGGSAQSLDQALTSQGLAPWVTGLEHGRGNADAAADLINDDGSVELANLPLRASDHDGLVLFIRNDADHDGFPDDQDVCPDTVIPESVPTWRLGVNRFALVDDDGVFDTVAPPGRGRGVGSFTVGDTGGCSCTQIIDALGLGRGHEKFGCSVGAMKAWVGIRGGE